MPTVELKLGSPTNNGDDVRRLKRYLRFLGLYPGPVDTTFDAAVQETVKKLQEAAGGTRAGSSGTVDVNTWNYIFDQLHVSSEFEAALEQRASLKEMTDKMAAMERTLTTLSTVNTTLEQMKSQVSDVYTATVYKGANNQAPITQIGVKVGEIQTATAPISDIREKVTDIEAATVVKPASGSSSNVQLRSLVNEIHSATVQKSSGTGPIFKIGEQVSTITTTTSALQEARIATAKAEIQLDADYARIAAGEAEKALQRAEQAVKTATEAETDRQLLTEITKNRDAARAQKQAADAAYETAKASGTAITTIKEATDAEQRARQARVAAAQAAQKAAQFAEAALAQKPAVVDIPSSGSSDNWESLKKLFDLDQVKQSGDKAAGTPTQSPASATSESAKT